MTQTNRIALGKAVNSNTNGIGMDKLVQTLLNGYQQPVVLSDHNNGEIIYSNSAAQNTLGLTSQQLSGSRLEDIFSSKKVIQHTVLWEYQTQYFEINEEKIALPENVYVKSVLKPVADNEFLKLLEIQKEMAKLLVHRFHSPLNGVTGFTELLKETDLSKKQSQYITSIEKGLGDFKKVLANLHDLARDLEVQYSAINVSEFAKEILGEFDAEERKQINLVLENGVIEIKSDYLLLKKIINELLQNALEHNADPHNMIYLQFKKNNIIRVTNYGNQIPKSYVQKMFYPFFSNKARNLGLGLSKCVLYAEELGYDIELAKNSRTEGISFDIKMD